MKSVQGTYKVLLVLFKQRNGNTAKTEEVDWSQKFDFEPAEYSVASVSRNKQVIFRQIVSGSAKRN